MMHHLERGIRKVSLSDTLKMLRTELGMTRQELAQAVYVSYVTASRWETGKTVPNPAASAAIMRLAETRNVSLSCRNELAQFLAVSASAVAEKESEEYVCELNRFPVGVGIYQVYPDGKIMLSYLNDGYYQLLHTTREHRRQFAGEAFLDAVHYEDRNKLVEEVHAFVQGKKPLNLEIRILAGKGAYRWFRIRANCIEQHEAVTTVYCVYMDIHDVKMDRLALEANRKVVHLAASAGKVSFWQFNIDQHIMTQEFDGRTPLGFPRRIEDFPAAIFRNGIFHPDDEPLARQMHQELESGAENYEITARVRNLNTNRLEWQRICYTRLHDTNTSDRIAVGFATNVTLQVMNQLRYERESQLRRELNQNALTYYQMNVSTKMLEEFYDKYSIGVPFILPAPVSEHAIQQILSYVPPEEQEDVYEMFSLEHILHCFHKGETKLTMLFHRNMPDGQQHWVKGSCTTMKHPSKDEVLAMMSVVDVDVERKCELALLCAVSEELESVIFLNPKTLRVVIAQETRALKHHSVGKSFLWNKTFRDMLVEEVLPEDRQKCADFIWIDHIVPALQENPVQTLTYRIRTQDGTIQRKKVRAFYLDERKDEIVFLRQDISDLYLEDQQKKQHLEFAVQEANRTNYAKNAFIARLSQEMRIPLQTILELTDHTLTGTANSDELQDAMRKIRASGQFLMEMINDLAGSASSNEQNENENR